MQNLIHVFKKEVKLAAQQNPRFLRNLSHLESNLLSTFKNIQSTPIYKIINLSYNGCKLIDAGLKTAISPPKIKILPSFGFEIKFPVIREIKIPQYYGGLTKTEIVARSKYSLLRKIENEVIPALFMNLNDVRNEHILGIVNVLIGGSNSLVCDVKCEDLRNFETKIKKGKVISTFWGRFEIDGIDERYTPFKYHKNFSFESKFTAANDFENIELEEINFENIEY